MRERPILFSAPMVLALLAGRKTQTRRVVKPRRRCSLFDLNYDGTPMWTDGYILDPGNAEWRMRDNPYGQSGDVLWVKETFRLPAEYNHLKPTLVRDGVPVWYEADGRAPEGWGKTRVSLHMQRRFSRLALRITDVRVQRLLDCSEADARAEGLQVKDETWMPQYRGADDLPWHVEFPRGAYFDLWDHINGPGASKADPWVWAVSFEIMKEGA